MKNPFGSKSRFVIKILLPTTLTIGLFITSFFIVLIPQFENIVYGRKREMIRELTNTAWSVLAQWHAQETRGKISREQAQASAVGQIRTLRYGEEGKDYFWITDHGPTMIMHPYRPDLDGKSLSHFEDSRGKRLFAEMAATVEKSSEGFVDYTWQWKDDSTRIVPKLSFVKGFADWGWIVGTGIYIEDVQIELAALERKIVNLSIGITVLISLLLGFIALQNLKAESRRQRAERELHDSREKYRALVESSTEGLIMVTTDREVFCNKTLYAMLGVPENPPGDLSFPLLFPEPPRTDTFDFGQFMPVPGRELKIEQVETKIRTRNGDVLDVLIGISPIRLARTDGIVLSVKDISRHKQMEDALDSSQEKYQALTNRLSLGVFRIAPARDGKFLEVNPAAVAILGAPDQDQLLKSSLFEFFDDDREGRMFFDTLLGQGIVRDWAAAVRRFDGTRAIVSLSAVLVRDKQGRPLVCDGLLEDVTEQKRTDSENENLLSDLHLAVVLLGQPLTPFVEPALSCGLHSTVGHAVERMAREKRDAVLVTASGDAAVGIVTEGDVCERVLARQGSLDAPVHSVMTAPVLSLPGSSTVCDALQVFTENAVSHVAIRDTAGRTIGLVRSRDIQGAFHASYLAFLRRIETLPSLRELPGHTDRLLFLVRTIIERGAGVADVTALTTAISGAFTRRIVSLTLADLGEPPVPFAFIGLGSDGRKEQTLRTDQDNAIVYADPPAGTEEAARDYFLRLGEQVCAALNAVGYRFCPGDIMAKNPRWCRPLSDWKTLFTEWVTTANPQDLLEAKIFFDFRLLAGSGDIVESLHAHLRSLLTGNNAFFLYLSESVLKWELPENAQKLKNPFDVKKVILPVVDGARLYALRHSIAATNTLERLALLYEADVFSRKFHEETAELYSVLMRKRFQHQARQLSERIPPDNEVDPAECSEMELMILKRAFEQIGRIREKISLDFKGVISR
ncbi:cache domain-containing protein [bacterium]|nr:cache domain-containing protein [bacterium]